MTPTYSIVCEELHAARQHLYDSISDLSLDEMLWTDGPQAESINHCFARVVATEDAITAATSRKAVLRSDLTAGQDGTDGSRPADLPPTAYRLPPPAPGPADILDAARQVRDNTIAYLALPFRAVRDEAEAIALAEPFRRIINCEYEGAAMIGRIRLKLGKPVAAAPPSKRATRQGESYQLLTWEEVIP